MPEIARKLTIKSGKNAGKPPSVASLYRALAEAGDGAAQPDEAPGIWRPVPARMERLQRQDNGHRG